MPITANRPWQKSRAAPRAARVKKELWLAALIVGAGLFVLPAAVYMVGLQVVGEYPAPGGIRALTLNVWADAVRGHPLALILVFGPYGIIQLLRLARRLCRRKQPTVAGGSVFFRRPMAHDHPARTARR